MVRFRGRRRWRRPSGAPEKRCAHRADESFLSRTGWSDCVAGVDCGCHGECHRSGVTRSEDSFLSRTGWSDSVAGVDCGGHRECKRGGAQRVGRELHFQDEMVRFCCRRRLRRPSGVPEEWCAQRADRGALPGPDGQIPWQASSATAIGSAGAAIHRGWTGDFYQGRIVRFRGMRRLRRPSGVLDEWCAGG